jgi:hypothetical protein
MTEYEDNKELRDAIEDMLADKSLVEFNPIRERNLTLFSLLCIRTDAKGEHVQGKGAPIICRKIPAQYRALTEGDYLVVADYYFWNHTDLVKRSAALYHALMHIHVETTEGGEVKLGIRKPEVQVFRSEIARFGPHTDVLLDFREAFKTAANRLTESMKAVA